ncbi:hypothetical protein EJ02DRAFT_510236 [Clathrospora elynae]|uniref:Uncharacterized protein n=1 Tax=Clathrospora elynae TaxID=706981 RepID=A0A6A5SWP1_9PLEO|nr:hypothetical protein EJ02DRAFT_510236 [Clathrospora elynae]
MKILKTPEQDKILKVPDTEERAHYFWHVENRHDGERLADIAANHGIDPTTGLKWRKEKDHFGDRRRVRKRKAEENDHKLGRPFRVPLHQLEALLDNESNPVRQAPYEVQSARNNIPLAARSLQYNVAKRLDAHLYLAAYSDKLLEKNKKERVQYGNEHGDKPLYGFWDGVHFTDEAHYNPTKDFQMPRILRRFKERLNPANICTRQKKKRDLRTLHMYALVNWYFKSELEFYNNQKDMLEIPKPPRQPVKSKYETPERHHKRVKEWEAKKPPPIEGGPGGHHMTQDYYSKTLLPKSSKSQLDPSYYSPCPES